MDHTFRSQAEDSGEERSPAEEAEELANTAGDLIASERVKEEEHLAVTGAKSPEESPYAATGAMHQVQSQRAESKARDERNAELIHIAEQVRQRIEELNRLIERLTQENKELNDEIQESRRHQERLRQARLEQAFDRDPETGEFTNEVVEQAVQAYEKRFGPVDRDNPELLIIVLQWAEEQERQAQAGRQRQIDDNNRRIDDARDEIDGYETKGSEVRHHAVAELENKDAKVEADLAQGLEVERASYLAEADDLFQAPLPSPESDDLDFLAENPETPFESLASSDDLDFLAMDEGASNLLPSSLTEASGRLNLEEGNITSPIDLQASFDHAVNLASHEDVPQKLEPQHTENTASRQLAQQSSLG